MNDLVLKQNTFGVITLKEITDLITVEHNKAMKVVDRLCLESSFGQVEKFTTLNLNNVKVETYLLTKKQAIAVGAKLNNSLLMKVIDRLEELESQKVNPILTVSEKIALIAQGHQEVENRLSSVETDLDYIKNKSPITYNQIKVLEDKRKSKTKQLVGYNPESEQSKKNYSKTISRLTKKFKDRFNISRYADLPKDNFEDALLFLNNIEMVDLI